VKDLRSEVSGDSDRTKWSKDVKREDRRSIGMVDVKKHKGSSEVPGSGQLLPAIHQGLCKSGSPFTPTSKKGDKMEVGRRTGESVLEDEESIHIGTSTGSP